MKFLHVTPYMDLRAGGPVVVVDRLCRQIVRRHHEAVVLTTDLYATADAGPKSDVGTEYELQQHHAVAGHYGYSSTLVAALDAIVPTCELVHVHTLWTYATAAAVQACRRHRVPYVVMPHGMLDPNSLSRKSLRKTVYGHLFEYPRLRQAAGMIYTTVQEQQLAESAVSRLPAGTIIPLGTDEPSGTRESLASQFRAARPDLAGKRLVCFLGRVHSKKGLDLLVPAFAKLVSRMPETHLLVVGPDDEGYWEQIQKVVLRLGLQSDVTRIDMLRGDLKWAALAASSIFVLPSYQENFAIAMAEACRIGTPVLISNRVNTWPTIEEGGAGRVIHCDVNELATTMGSMLENTEGLRQMSEAAVAVACEHFDWSRSADLLLEAYERILCRAGRKWAPPAVAANPVVETAVVTY